MFLFLYVPTLKPCYYFADRPTRNNSPDCPYNKKLSYLRLISKVFLFELLCCNFGKLLLLTSRKQKIIHFFMKGKDFKGHLGGERIHSRRKEEVNFDYLPRRGGNLKN